jgi:hypothetical protein
MTPDLTLVQCRDLARWGLEQSNGWYWVYVAGCEIAMRAGQGPYAEDCYYIPTETELCAAVFKFAQERYPNRGVRITTHTFSTGTNAAEYAVLGQSDRGYVNAHTLMQALFLLAKEIKERK